MHFHTCISRLASPILGALLLMSAPPPLESSETGVPGGLAYVWWKFDRAEFEDFQIDITIYNDLAATPGLYFQMYQGQIGDIGFYFGLQTDVYQAGAGILACGSDGHPCPSISSAQIKNQDSKSLSTPSSPRRN